MDNFYNEWRMFFSTAKDAKELYPYAIHPTKSKGWRGWYWRTDSEIHGPFPSGRACCLHAGLTIRSRQ